MTKLETFASIVRVVPGAPARLREVCAALAVVALSPQAQEVEVCMLTKYHRKKYSCVSFLLTLCLSLGPAWAAETAAPQNGIFLSAHGLSPVFSLREPVFVDLEIENSFPHRIELDLGVNFEGNLRLRLVKPDGMEVNARRQEPAEGSAYSQGIVSLLPRGMYSRSLLLNEWFDIDQLGEYSLEISAPSGEKGAKPLEADIRFKVIALDRTRLAGACEKLEAAALDGDAEAQSRAGNALGVVADEACLRSYEKVVARSLFGKEGVITALTHLATTDALAILIGQWDHLRWDQQALALREARAAGREADLANALTQAHKKRKPFFSDQADPN